MSDSGKIHEITIKRQVVVQGASGGTSTTYTKAARSGLPTSAECRAIIMNPKERLDHGVRGDVEGWKFLFFEEDPKIDLRDRIEFNYVNNQSEAVKVLVPSRARLGGSASSHHWRCFGEQDTSES